MKLTTTTWVSVDGVMQGLAFWIAAGLVVAAIAVALLVLDRAPAPEHTEAQATPAPEREPAYA